MAESGKLIFLNRAVNALAIAQEEKGVMKGVDGEFRNFDLKLLPFHKIHSKLAFSKEYIPYVYLSPTQLLPQSSTDWR